MTVTARLKEGEIEFQEIKTHLSFENIELKLEQKKEVKARLIKRICFKAKYYKY